MRVHDGNFLNAARRLYMTATPKLHHENYGFYVVAIGSDKPGSVLMTGPSPDLSFWGSGGGLFLPSLDLHQGRIERWRPGFRIGGLRRGRRVRVPPGGQHQRRHPLPYRGAVGGQVTKDDIFHSVYGLLHHSPPPGARLADLHVNYESVEPYELDVDLKKGTSTEDRETWRVSKMK